MIKNLSEYAARRIECRCGETHEITTKFIRAGEGAITALGEDLAAFVPSGSLISVLTTPTVQRVCREVEKSLYRSGYRCEILPIEGNKLDALPQTAEESALLVGVGGGRLCDMAKLKARASGLPLYLVPTSLSGVAAPSAFATSKDGFCEAFKAAAPLGLSVDFEAMQPPSRLVAAGFGELISRMLSLTDYHIAAIFDGQNYCRATAAEAYEIITECGDFAGRLQRGDRRLIKAIAEANLKLSLLSQGLGGSQLYAGGDVQATFCSDMLARREGRRPLIFGETAFIYARNLARFYLEACKLRYEGFLPPPDNNRRMELIAEYLGVDFMAAPKKLRSICGFDRLKLMNYKLSEYAEELKRELGTVVRTLALAERTFKRLYDDDGYAVTGSVDEGSLCVALAPDVKERFTFLTYLKQAGLLDNFLY